MRKSTRALLGMVALDVLIGIAAGWMVVQTRSGAWHAGDPAGAVSLITTSAGAAIGVITAILLVAFFVHRRTGN